MAGRLNIPSTKKTGRKIETWDFKLPDETIAIDVLMYANAEGTTFVASTKHAAFSQREWRDTDINRLATAVEADIDRVMDDLVQDRWQPCLILDVEPDRRSTDMMSHASVSITIKHARRDTETPRDNTGRVRIEHDGRIGFAQERDPSDCSSTESQGHRIKLDSEGSRSVIPDSEEARHKIAKLQETLERFGYLLAQRVSPFGPNPDILPDPSDLADMMQIAAQDSSR